MSNISIALRGVNTNIEGPVGARRKSVPPRFTPQQAARRKESQTSSPASSTIKTQPSREIDTKPQDKVKNHELELSSIPADREEEIPPKVVSTEKDEYYQQKDVAEMQDEWSQPAAQDFEREAGRNVAEAGFDSSMDSVTLANNLYGIAGEKGIFEVMMPNGQKMGVAVDAQPDQVSYLLTPSNEELDKKLRRHRMELEGRLERRIEKTVKITVL